MRRRWLLFNEAGEVKWHKSSPDIKACYGENTKRFWHFLQAPTRPSLDYKCCRSSCRQWCAA